MKIFTQRLLVAPAVAAMLLNFASANAKQISPEEAISRIGIEARDGVAEMPSLESKALKLAYTYKANYSIERPMMYVFTPASGNGFVISAADDEFPAVIGYSETSGFDASRISPTMEWWLEQYEREMSWILEHPEAAAAPMRAELGEAVAPMLKTTWDQSTPFNNMTPTVGQNKTVTGCVATAMAQILKYHNYPPKGQGFITYKWAVTGESLSMNFGGTTFDWDNMLDNYITGDNRNYSQEEADAVATLMKACGYSVRMNYTAGASGASSYAPAPALVEYFNYSRDIRNISRDFYTIMEWEKIIYSNVAANHPVLLCGQSGTGGHAFVCDGYSSNHYFHINWGWGGFQDGYFLLSMLNPLSGGIGSSAGGYNSMQTAVINIIPEAGGTAEEGKLYCNGNFTFADLAEDGSEYMFKALGVPLAGFYNFGSTVFRGQVGLIIENPDKTLTDYPYNYTVSIEPGYGVSYIPGKIQTPPATGQYKLYPAYRLGEEGALVKMPVYEGCNPYIVMTIDNQGKATFANAPVEKEVPEIEVTAFENVDGVAYRNFPSTIKVTVKNSSTTDAYSAPISMKLYKGSMMVQEKSIFVSVWPEESFTQTAALTWNLAAGEYDVVFTDTAGKTIGSGYTVTIEDGTPSNLQSHLKMTDVTPTSFNPNQSYTLHITFTNDYAAQLTLPLDIVIYDKDDVKIDEMNIPSISYPANSTSVLRADGFVTDFGTGDFFIQFFSNGDAVSEKFPIQVGARAESITISPESLTLEVGKTAQITGKILPANAIVSSLIWESANTAIAKVSKSGLVTGVAPGTTTVTVTVGSNGPKATCEVTVLPDSGIDQIFNGEETITSVATADGKVLSGITTKEQLKNLPAGVYIIGISGRQIKVMIGK